MSIVQTTLYAQWSRCLTETEGVDLLLDLFQRQFVIIPHPEVFLNRGILICWNMNRVVAAIGKALCDHRCITFVGFDPFPCWVSIVVGARIVHLTPALVS